MNPLLLPLLFQGASGVLGGIFGHGQDKAERKRRAEIMRLADPAYLRQLQQQFYNQALAGPAFSQGARGIYNAGQSMTNRLQGSLAARGLSNSGVGSIAPALAASSTAGQLGNLRTNLYNAAGSQAGASQAQQLATLQGLGPQPNYMGQAIGGSLADIGSFLGDYYKPKPAATANRNLDTYFVS